MSRSSGAISVFLILAGFLSVVTGCRSRPRIPDQPAVAESLIQEYVAEGDAAFQGMHLTAWRRAEAAYAEAFRLAPRPEIREKLADARFLRMTREIDEDIPHPDLQQDIQFLCGNPVGFHGRIRCDLARAFPEGPATSGRIGPVATPSEFGVEDSALNAYFFILAGKTLGSGPDFDEVSRELFMKYQDSPLFVYLSLSSPAGAHSLSRTIQQDPGFAEAWEFSGEMSFQRSAVKPAREAFTRALTLVPDFTRANNGLANIYFFTLEDFENALKTYEQTLRIDAGNSTALFGKSACLHHLGRYRESNEGMDAMLAGDLSRGGRVDAENVRYYRGEAYYYKAYNCHLLQEPSEARRWIDLALKELPNSEEINYLSGLLHFEAGEPEISRNEFEKAVRQGTRCYGYHYLGLIALRLAAPGAAAQFLTCTACLERGLRNLEDRLDSLSQLELEPAEKASLQSRMERKLEEYRDTSLGLVQRMTGMIREAPMSPESKKDFLEMIDGIALKLAPRKRG